MGITTTPRRIAAVGICFLVFSSVYALAQDSSASAKKQTTSGIGTSSHKVELPRTPWGDPDLQGIWSNSQDTSTPFERPVEMGTRMYLTDAEYAKKADQYSARKELRNGGSVYLDASDQSRRTSLIVDPPDGRVPPLTLEGKQRVEAAVEERKKRNNLPASAADISLWSRCITRTLPGGWIPFAYNNYRQIVQTRNYVVIYYEEIHDARIIPLDGRPHVGSDIRYWMGDSRGHWEGNTLVVDATNFRDRINFRGSPSEADDMPVSDHARVLERFTRIDKETIDYKVTIDDPGTFTKPWTLDIPMEITSQTQILEYACHEGNYNPITAELGGARAIEAEAQAKKTQ